MGRVKRESNVSSNAAQKTKKAKDSAPLPISKSERAWQDNSQGNLCAEHLIKVHEALKTIRDCPFFHDIETADPLTVSQGASQEPFAQATALQILARQGGHYNFAGNFFWCDQVWLANHRVPINKGQIAEIQRFYFNPVDPPISFPYEICAAVSAGTEEELSRKGSFQRLSPPEPAHALLFAVESSIKRAAPEAILKRWRQVILTVPFRLEKVDLGEARFWRAQHLREEMVERGVTVKLSIIQRVYDVAGFKANKEASLETTLSPGQVAAAYEKHLKAARGSEPIKESFVDTAISVHQRILSIPECRLLLEELDAQFLTGNPLKSIYSLQGLLDRAGTARNISFALRGLIDGFRKGFVDAGTFSSMKIRDPRASSLH